MPFVAEKEGELVTPISVDDDEVVECPACDSEMSVRNKHRRDETFVARHFVHHPDEDCDGESDEHRRMKSIAASKLLAKYDDEATVTVEAEVAGRVADILVEFDSPRDPDGKGVAVEVQHRNKAKDTDAVTNHYLAEGYSVLWLYKHHFTGMDVSIDHYIPLWPNVIDDTDFSTAYPSVVTDPERDSVEKTVPVPQDEFDVSRTDRRDLRWHWMLGRINDYRGKVPEPESDGQWNEAITVTLGVDGSGKITLLDTPDGGQVLQFSKRGSQYADIDLGIRLSPREDVQNLVKFCLDIDELFEVAADQDGNGIWESVCHMKLGGGEYRTKWIELSVGQNGTPGIRLCNKNPQDSDIPIRITRDDIEVLYEFVASLAARNSITRLQRTSHRIINSKPNV